MMRIGLRAVFLSAAALMLVFVNTARSNVSKGACTAVRAVSVANAWTNGLHLRPVMRAMQTAGGAQLFLLAEEVVPESQAMQEDPPPSQEVPLVDPVVDQNTDTPPQPEPEPVDPPEQSQPLVEHEQVPEPEPAPDPAPQPSQQ